MADGRIEIKFSADTTQVKSATETVGKLGASLDGAEKSFSNTGISAVTTAKAIAMAQVSLQAIGSAFRLVSGALGDIVGEMNDSTKAWRTFEANMEILGKSSTEIDKVKKSLQDYATETVYSASDMASTYSQLAAVGTESTEELVKGFGGLAAAAESPEQAMKTLSQQATQMAGRPTVAWEDFKLMLEQTPAGIAAVAKEMGMSTSEMVTAVQDGTIATEDFFEAVIKVGNSDAFSQMATEFKTTDQAMDGLRETLANKLLPAFEIVNDIGIKAISGISDWIDTVNLDALMVPLRAIGELLGLEVETDSKSARGQINTLKGQVLELKSVFDSVSNGVKSLGDSVQKFIKPALNLFGDFTRISMERLGGYVRAFERLINGDWSGAWELFTDNAVGSFNDIVNSIKEHVPEMWKNFKELGAGVWEWFDDIDWGKVGKQLDDFLGNISEVVATVDWVAVAGEVSGVISDFIGKTKVWLEENVPKTVDFIQEVLLNPESKLNKDAAAFKQEVFNIFDSFIEGLGIQESIMEWVIRVNAKPFFSWGSWQDEIDHIMSIFENKDYNQSVFMDISIQRSQGKDEEQIQQIIDDLYGKGTYETHVDVMLEAEHTVKPDKDWKNYFKDNPIAPIEAPVDVELDPNAEVNDSTSWIDEITNVFKTKTVSAQVEVEPLFSSSVGSGVQSTSFDNAPTIDFSSLQTSIEAGFGAIQSAIQSYMNATNANVASSVSQILATFNSGISPAYTAGQMLGLGFNDGLASMHARVVNTAVAMANAAVQAINSALGVASPAKEGIYSGSMLGQGVVLGGEREIGAIEDMGERMARAAIPDFAGIDINSALNLPRFGTTDSQIGQVTTTSVGGFDSLGRKLDALINKKTDIYMDKEKVGGMVSPTVDRSIGRESIFEERWGI